MKFELVSSLVKGDAFYIVSDMPNLCIDENDELKEGCQAMYIKYDLSTQTKPFTGICSPFEIVEGSDLCFLNYFILTFLLIW